MADEPAGGDTQHGFTIQGIVTIIGAIFLGLTQMFQMWLTYQREITREVQAKAVAAKVEEVATKQTQAVAEVKTAIDDKAREHADTLNAVSQQVGEMKAEVVKEVHTLAADKPL